MRKKLIGIMLTLIMLFSISAVVYAGAGCGPTPPRSLPPPCIECECVTIVPVGGGDGPNLP